MILVTYARYRNLTGDLVTDAATVSARVEDATHLIEEALDRELDSESRTETMRIYPDRRAYPQAWPVTTAPTGAEVDTVTEARAIRDVSPDDVAFGVFQSFPNEPHATLTYTGGYTQHDGTTPIPHTLERAIADLAHALIFPAKTPVGATSLRLGDASVTFGRSQDHPLDAYLGGLWDRVKRYRRRDLV